MSDLTSIRAEQLATGLKSELKVVKKRYCYIKITAIF